MFIKALIYQRFLFLPCTNHVPSAIAKKNPALNQKIALGSLDIGSGLKSFKTFVTPIFGKESFSVLCEKAII